MKSYEEIIDIWIKKNNPRRLLNLSYYDKEELPDLPDTVEYLDISDSCILHLKNLPSSLKYLRCRYSNIISVELPLPPNLHYFNVRHCEDLLPFDVPKHITFLSDIEFYTKKKRYEEEKDNEDDNIHYQFAIKRIEEWKIENLQKKNKKPLDLSWLRIKDYSIIPHEVEHLITSGNRELITLESIPTGLKRLEYDSFPFNNINGLPDGLEYLEIKRSKIEIINKLPNTIKKLLIKDNSSDLVIKSLPESLKELYINNHYTIYYPINIRHRVTTTCIDCEFPLNLRKLFLKCHLVNNYIPIFPNSLHFIDLSYTLISNIQYLPPKLKVLILSDIENSLPLLPEDLLVIKINDIKKLDDNIIPCSVRWISSCTVAFIDKNIRYNTILFK